MNLQTGATVTTTAASVAWWPNLVEGVQLIAGLIAIIVGSVTLYSWWKNRK